MPPAPPLPTQIRVWISSLIYLVARCIVERDVELVCSAVSSCIVGIPVPRGDGVRRARDIVGVRRAIGLRRGLGRLATIAGPGIEHVFESINGSRQKPVIHKGNPASRSCGQPK